jgi:hypothetical protein
MTNLLVRGYRVRELVVASRIHRGIPSELAQRANPSDDDQPDADP